jgi:hypothetical protein
MSFDLRINMEFQSRYLYDSFYRLQLQYAVAGVVDFDPAKAGKGRRRQRFKQEKARDL